MTCNRNTQASNTNTPLGVVKKICRFSNLANPFYYQFHRFPNLKQLISNPIKLQLTHK